MRLLLGLVVLGLGALVGWYLMGGKNPIQLPNAPTPTVLPRITQAPVDNLLRTSSFPSGNGVGGSEKGGEVARLVVTYTDTGFAPSPLMVSVGQTVTFVNESTGGMWVASAVHPTHSVLPGFDQKKSVAKGASYEYMFLKVGTWKYHNHVKPSDTATVVVSN